MGADCLTVALAAVVERLGPAGRIWLGTHVDPDGDAIGSMLGLARVLAAQGKDVVTACQDPVPPEVTFLPGADAVTTLGPAPGALIVALDAADRKRLGRLLGDETPANPAIVIDHHVTNPGYGEVNLIDAGAASTAELVLELCEAMDAPIDAGTATCLLAGIVSDTLGFRTSNTTAVTLDRARRLMDRGASLPEIAARVFDRPLATLRLVARAIERLETRGPVALTTLRLVDFAEFGAGPSDVRGITMLLSAAAEPRVLAVLRERDDGRVDVSLRSKAGVDLIPVARALGGGGHPQAAGALVAGPIGAARETVLAALDAPVPEASR
jgi:bifunctional oligoribonuclease and PAP phosphatase NrnA